MSNLYEKKRKKAIQSPKEYMKYCQSLKQSRNKLSDRGSLLTPTLPPEKEKKEEKGERLTN